MPATHLLTVPRAPVTIDGVTTLQALPSALLEVTTDTPTELTILLRGRPATLPRSCAVPLITAEAFLTERLMADPLDTWAWHQRGLVRKHHGDDANACDDFSEALRHTPSSVELLRLRARVRLRLQQYDLARADIDKALRLEPHEPSTLLVRG
jgi:Tfp pilus assembly protein PilF